jgi:hypothetical protein
VSEREKGGNAEQDQKNNRQAEAPENTVQEQADGAKNKFKDGLHPKSKTHYADFTSLYGAFGPSLLCYFLEFLTRRVVWNAMRSWSKFNYHLKIYLFNISRLYCPTSCQSVVEIG